MFIFVIYELHKINIRLFISPLKLNKNSTAKKPLLTLLFIFEKKIVMKVVGFYRKLNSSRE
jgi:hypothetical protein